MTSYSKVLFTYLPINLLTIYNYPPPLPSPNWGGGKILINLITQSLNFYSLFTSPHPAASTKYKPHRTISFDTTYLNWYKFIYQLKSSIRSNSRIYCTWSLFNFRVCACTKKSSFLGFKIFFILFISGFIRDICAAVTVWV